MNQNTNFYISMGTNKISNFCIFKDTNATSKENFNSLVNSPSGRTSINSEIELESSGESIYLSTNSNETSETSKDYHDSTFKDKIAYLIETLESELIGDRNEQDTFILLTDILIYDNKYFVQYIMTLINEHRLNFNTVSELLLKLGIINSKINDTDIEWLLHWFLFHEDSRLRYGAMLGISYVRSPNSLPYLEIALKNEDVEVLKKDIIRLINRIKSECLSI